jgi:hypothetical protein
LLVALGLVVYLIAQAPHLVHHLFDPEEFPTDCPLATAGDRLPGIEPHLVDVAPEPEREPIVESPTVWSPQRSHRVSAARSPPPTA